MLIDAYGKINNSIDIPRSISYIYKEFFKIVASTYPLTGS
jgi:hypothetical protein